MTIPYRVYIAAASTPDQIERAKRCASRLRDLGFEIASSWTEVVASVGSANPRDANPEDRRIWSSTCLDELAGSDALLLLCPPPGVVTRGAWVELGRAHGCGLHGPYIVSSGDTKQSIFCALGRECETDEDAIERLVAFRGGKL